MPTWHKQGVYPLLGTRPLLRGGSASCGHWLSTCLVISVAGWHAQREVARGGGKRPLLSAGQQLGGERSLSKDGPLHMCWLLRTGSGASPQHQASAEGRDGLWVGRGVVIPKPCTLAHPVKLDMFSIFLNPVSQEEDMAAVSS